MPRSATRDWDAATYQRVSVPHVEWARSILDRLRRIAADLQAREPFAPHFEGFAEPWNDAGAEETEARLRAVGFDEAHCRLQPSTVEPPEPAEFLRAVCLGPQLDRLPEDLRDPFLTVVLGAEPSPLQLDYVRLNIDAT